MKDTYQCVTWTAPFPLKGMFWYELFHACPGDTSQVAPSCHRHRVPHLHIHVGVLEATIDALHQLGCAEITIHHPEGDIVVSRPPIKAATSTQECK